MKEFIDYLLDFYGPHGVYPYGFTTEEIVKAIPIRQRLFNFEFAGDSLDREIVRDIVLKMRDPESATEYEISL